MSNLDSEGQPRQSTDQSVDDQDNAAADVVEMAGEGPSELPAGPTPPAWTLPVVGGGSILAALLWVLWRLRRRRRQPTPSERLAEATRAAGAASVGLAGRTAGWLSDTTSPVAERTGELTRHGIRSSAEGAQRAVATVAPVIVAGAGAAAREAMRAGSFATQEASGLASRASEVGVKAAHAGHRVSTSLADVPHMVVEGGEKVHSTWTKWTRRVLISVSAGVGYVLGARAGHERYEQIAGVASQVGHRPEVQRARSRIQGAMQQQSRVAPGVGFPDLDETTGSASLPPVEPTRPAPDSRP